MRDSRGHDGSDDSAGAERPQPDDEQQQHEPPTRREERREDAPTSDTTAGARDELGEEARNDAERPAQPHPALERALADWRRRRYRVGYADETLAQLARREFPSWDVIALGLAALGALGLAALLLRLAWRRWKRWSVVSLTVTPDDHVITHQQNSRRRPEL